MPVRAVISPKFTYSQGSQQFWVRTAPSGSTSDQNGMFLPVFSATYNNVIMPPFKFPEMGNTHYDRKGNRITITSLRLKVHFKLWEDLLRRWQPGDTTNTYSSIFSAGQSLPLNPLMFFKMRLFLLRIDDDIDITPQKLLNWYLATYCYYRNPTADPSPLGPHVSGADQDPAPISVHSNVLRLTTPWTGKFNVLADRKFTVRTTKPIFDIDMTIPMKKEFVFSEDSNDLLYPKYYIVIFGPLSKEVDVDPSTSALIGYNSEYRLGTVYTWTKLNFVDL